MSHSDYEAAIAEFMRKKGITRCPTACAVPTRATLAETDRAALRDYGAAREAVRLEKLRNFRQLLAS